MGCLRHGTVQKHAGIHTEGQDKITRTSQNNQISGQNSNSHVPNRYHIQYWTKPFVNWLLYDTYGRLHVSVWHIPTSCQLGFLPFVCCFWYHIQSSWSISMSISERLEPGFFRPSSSKSTGYWEDPSAAFDTPVKWSKYIYHTHGHV